MELRIMSCRAYREKQQYVQKNQYILLSLNVSGVEHMDIMTPDGTPAGSAGNFYMERKCRETREAAERAAAEQ